MKTIYFNTGRPYGAYGQRITATLYDDGVTITFFDHARLVDGEITSNIKIHPDNFTARDVMRFYDAGQNRSTKRSWEDGMITGNCNSRWRP